MCKRWTTLLSPNTTPYMTLMFNSHVRYNYYNICCFCWRYLHFFLNYIIYGWQYTRHGKEMGFSIALLHVQLPQEPAESVNSKILANWTNCRAYYLKIRSCTFVMNSQLENRWFDVSNSLSHNGQLGLFPLIPLTTKVSPTGILFNEARIQNNEPLEELIWTNQSSTFIRVHFRIY